MKRMVLGLAFGCVIGVANARDLGQWEAGDTMVRDWYQALMQPDNPSVSCCGEADGRPRYRIKSKTENVERVVTEEQISRLG